MTCAATANTTAALEMNGLPTINAAAMRTNIAAQVKPTVRTSFAK